MSLVALNRSLDYAFSLIFFYVSYQIVKYYKTIIKLEDVIVCAAWKSLMSVLLHNVYLRELKTHGRVSCCRGTNQHLYGLSSILWHEQHWTLLKSSLIGQKFMIVWKSLYLNIDTCCDTILIYILSIYIYIYIYIYYTICLNYSHVGLVEDS